jgi:type IV pilus assembly protein PilE
MSFNRLGFTRVEVLLSVSIVTNLVAIALPIYSGYVNHSRASRAASDLVALSLELENAFQKNLIYPEYAAGTVIPAAPENRAGPLSVDFPAWAPAEGTYFTYSVSSTAASYIVTATEQGNLNCTISLTNHNVRTATGTDCGFTKW